MVMRVKRIFAMALAIIVLLVSLSTQVVLANGDDTQADDISPVRRIERSETINGKTVYTIEVEMDIVQPNLSPLGGGESPDGLIQGPGGEAVTLSSLIIVEEDWPGHDYEGGARLFDRVGNPTGKTWPVLSLNSIEKANMEDTPCWISSGTPDCAQMTGEYHTSYGGDITNVAFAEVYWSGGSQDNAKVTANYSL
jgi:hypothetical protein